MNGLICLNYMRRKMSKIFDIKESVELLRHQSTSSVDGFHKSFDYMKEITIKLLTNLLILNGGAVVVTLTFVGALVNSPKSALISGFVEPLTYFAIGSAISVVLCGITYISQSYYTDASRLDVHINGIYEYLYLNEQKIEFYTNQYEVKSGTEFATLESLLNSLNSKNEQYEKTIEQWSAVYKCKNCNGSQWRMVGIILFIINLALFFYGIYLMVGVFKSIQ